MATVLALTSATLVACGGDKKANTTNNEVETADVAKFPVESKNEKKAIKDGTLDVAVVADSSFRGLFSAELYEDNVDMQFMRPSHESLFTTDEDFVITNDGPAKLDLDVENKKATITIQKDLTWSDGEKVTADDLIWPYEIIGHKDYTGVRYDNNMTNIIGMEDYHDGKSETISGIKKVDDKTITIEYKDVNPGLLQSGGGIWENAAPKHAMKDIPVKDLASSDIVRKRPITFGPYVMTNVVNGEAVEYQPNKYYYKGTPKLAKINFTSVASASIVEALKAKKYDMVVSMPTDIYSTYKDLENYSVLGRPELSYTYLGFKLGKWDKAQGQVIPNPDAKMADEKLRQAMGYAVNNDEVGKKFYNGLRTNATTLIPPVFKSLHDKDIKGYTQNKEKARDLLKEAGYKDKDGDGFVEDKNGKKLVIKFASMSGGETAQPLADYYIQEWKDIGLNVELATGRLIDVQSFYDKLKNDDPEIDIYQGAWGTGTDPSPTGLYGRHSFFNHGRFADEENDKLLQAIDSKESFDPEKRQEAFYNWQKYASKKAFVIPTLYRTEVMPVHDRVTGLDWHQNNFYMWSEIGVTQEKR